jgi:hypothetical protein
MDNRCRNKGQRRIGGPFSDRRFFDLRRRPPRLAILTTDQDFQNINFGAAGAAVFDVITACRGELIFNGGGAKRWKSGGLVFRSHGRR